MSNQKSRKEKKAQMMNIANNLASEFASESEPPYSSIIRDSKKAEDVKKAENMIARNAEKAEKMIARDAKKAKKDKRSNQKSRKEKKSSNDSQGN